MVNKKNKMSVPVVPVRIRQSIRTGLEGGGGGGVATISIRALLEYIENGAEMD